MIEDHVITEENLFRILQKIENEIGEKEVKSSESEIQAFCEIIDDRNPLYFNDSIASELGLEGKIIPLGYLMSLTNKYLRPLLIGKKYLIKIKFDRPVKKVGRKGTSFNVNFKTSIIDINGIVHAVDNHYFFFKIRKEGEFKSNES